MKQSQGLPGDGWEVEPRAEQEGADSQRPRESPCHQEACAATPIPGEAAGEGVSASAAPKEQARQSTVTSHSSTRIVEPVATNYLCTKSPCDPPGRGMKRKRSAVVRDTKEEEQEKHLYYYHVTAVNGITMAWETRFGFGPIKKRPRIYKAKYTVGEDFAGLDQSSHHTRSELGDEDTEAEDSTRGQGEEAPAQNDDSEAVTVTPQDFLPTQEGLQCLACCRIFPSLEALTHHVKHGLREGFSCRVFYRVMAAFRARNKAQRRR
ncbi:protein FAM170A-like [Alligator sinensis]|uniref:Protein FAM170A-like n=1 Tax=Alligator sinensis TaxID=38654 RepID=A0A1U7RVI3_ALLSI|nr:protein FAM170A-like [Alligator sinensis]